MPRLQEQLPELFELARDHREEARIQLAGRLAELFLAGDIVLTESEEQQVGALIDQLLVMKNLNVRTDLLKKFANVAQMPRLVAVKIANEKSDLAKEILRTSETLTDADLVQVVDVRGVDHAKAIAQRHQIAEAVTDALVATGDISVMQTVAENLGAALSSKAVEILGNAAKLTIALQEPVMRRSEMTPALATKLYWWLAQDVRRYTLQRFGFSSVSMSNALQAVINEKLEAHAFDKNDDATVVEMADWLEDREALTASLLPEVLRAGQFKLFGIMLSRLSHIKATLIDRVVSEAGGRMLAAVCRAVGVDKANFVSIFLLSRAARPGEQIVHPRELSLALAAFDRLTVEVAQDMVGGWSADPAYLLSRAEDKLAAQS